MSDPSAPKSASPFRVHPGPRAWAVAEPLGGEECEHCDDRGLRIVQRDGVDVVQPCLCRAVRDACRRFDAARIPRLLADKTLDGYRPYSPGEEKAKRRVLAFLEGYGEAGTRGFVLMGRPGTGKTHLLTGTLRQLTLHRGVSARYVEFFHLLSELKEGYSQGKSDLEIIAPLAEVEVLAIDELGKGRGSEWELYVLDELISRRYNAGRVTLFATNYTTEKETTLKDRAAARSGYVATRGRAFQEEITAETLEQRVGERIYSRLNEMCELVPVDGPDYRKAAFTDAGALR